MFLYDDIQVKSLNDSKDKFGDNGDNRDNSNWRDNRDKILTANITNIDTNGLVTVMFS